MTLVSSEAQFSAVLAAKISDLAYFVIFLHECLNEKDSVSDTRFFYGKNDASNQAQNQTKMFQVEIKFRVNPV